MESEFANAYIRPVYAVGNVSEVVAGKLENSLVVTRSLEEAKNNLAINDSFSLIAAPNVIGGYLAFFYDNNKDHKLPAETLDSMTLDEIQDYFGHGLIDPTLQFNFSVHPDIVQVGHTKSMPPELIEPFLGQHASRMKIFLYDSMNLESDEMREYLRKLEGFYEVPPEKRSEHKAGYLELAKKIKSLGGVNLWVDMALHMSEEENRQERRIISPGPMFGDMNWRGLDD